MQNSGPRTRKYIHTYFGDGAQSWLDFTLLHHTMLLILAPTSSSLHLAVGCQKYQCSHCTTTIVACNNAIRQSHSPTRSLGRSVGRSISHLSTHRRRRNKAVASCYVTWLASAKYTLDHAQPFGRGTCKKKMIVASNCSTTRKCIDENCGRSFRWTSSVGYTLLVYCFP